MTLSGNRSCWSAVVWVALAMSAVACANSSSTLIERGKLNDDTYALKTAGRRGERERASNRPRQRLEEREFEDRRLTLEHTARFLINGSESDARARGLGGDVSWGCLARSCFIRNTRSTTPDESAATLQLSFRANGRVDRVDTIASTAPGEVTDCIRRSLAQVEIDGANSSLTLKLDFAFHFRKPDFHDPANLFFPTPDYDNAKTAPAAPE